MAFYTLRKPTDEVKGLLVKQLNELRATKDNFVRAHNRNGRPKEYRQWEKYTITLAHALFVEGADVAGELLEDSRPISMDFSVGGRQDDFRGALEGYEGNLESLIERLPHMRQMAPTNSNPTGSAELATNSSPIKIFISHSAKDEAFAKAIVDLLEGSLNVGDDAIRCTSVDGHKLKPGDNSADTLRAEIQSCDVLIALLTKDSLASKFVLMELGAAWVLNRRVCPVLAPSVKWGKLPGPFALIHGVKADDRGGLVSVVEMVKEATKFEPRSREKGDACLTSTLATLKKLFPEPPRRVTRSLPSPS